jgi:putative ABC transport system permease protein
VQLVLHASTDPGALVPSLRAALAGLDKDVPISEVQTLEQIVTTSVAARRFTMTLFVAFAALALVLALGGIHGVLAYSVARRTAEIGVRVALGATERSVLGLVVRQGMRPVVAGLAVGLLAAVALSRLLTTLLVDVPPTDPVTYGVVAVVLLAAATLACVIPALKALRVDVTSALRIE